MISGLTKMKSFIIAALVAQAVQFVFSRGIHLSIEMENPRSASVDYSEDDPYERLEIVADDADGSESTWAINNNIHEDNSEEEGPYHVKIVLPDDIDQQITEDNELLSEELMNYAPNFIISGPGSEQLIDVKTDQREIEEMFIGNKEMLVLDPELEEQLLRVRQRLQKLDFYFGFLRVMSEDCRQRMLCEVLREPSKFYPLSSILEDATSLSDEFFYMDTRLASTIDGARLMSYLEAAFSALDRERSCTPYRYRCPSHTEEMINYDSLSLWREMVRWLTIHVIAKTPVGENM